MARQKREFRPGDGAPHAAEGPRKYHGNPGLEGEAREPGDGVQGSDGGAVTGGEKPSDKAGN